MRETQLTQCWPLASVHVCIHVHTYIRIHICMHMCTYTYVHTQIIISLLNFLLLENNCTGQKTYILWRQMWSSIEIFVFWIHLFFWPLVFHCYGGPGRQPWRIIILDFLPYQRVPRKYNQCPQDSPEMPQVPKKICSHGSLGTGHLQPRDVGLAFQIWIQKSITFYFSHPSD